MTPAGAVRQGGSRLDKDPQWKGDWSVGLRVWIECSGEALLGDGRADLLEGIERWGSISAAARHVGMSYRHAWLLVDSVNQAAGEPLVEAAVGGRRGGGARLTQRGRQAIAAFRRVQHDIRQAAQTAAARYTDNEPLPAVHVAAAVSLEEVLGQLLADFAARHPQVRVRTLFGASDELADQVLAGACADLFLTADPRQLDRLAAAGLVAGKSRVPLAQNTLAAIAQDGWSGRVTRPAQLLGPQVKRIALALPSSPLGRYSEAYLTRCGLHRVLCPRALPADNARAVIAAVRSGRADVGIVYASDAAAAGCRVLFRAPRSSVEIRYEGAVLAGRDDPVNPKLLLEFLASSAAARRLRACGFTPPARSNRPRPRRKPSRS